MNEPMPDTDKSVSSSSSSSSPASSSSSSLSSLPSTFYASLSSSTSSPSPSSTSSSSSPSPSSLIIASCTTCRWTGTVTFTGISLWLLYERSRIERHARAHRGVLAVMSLGFATAAVVRWRL